MKSCFSIRIGPMQNPPPVPLLPDQILTLTDTLRSASSHQPQPYCFPSMLAVVCQHLLLVLKEKEEVGHLQAGCYHPGCIYLSMEGAWTQDKHSCHSAATAREGWWGGWSCSPFLSLFPTLFGSKEHWTMCDSIGWLPAGFAQRLAPQNKHPWPSCCLGQAGEELCKE